MTENSTSGYAPPPGGTGYAPPPAGPPAPPAPRPPLRRTRDGDRVLGGVAAGLARWLGIDPILVRVGFVVLAIFGGSGILLYLAGWLFVPEEGQESSAGERFLRDNTTLAVVAAVFFFLLVVGPTLAWGWWGDGSAFVSGLVAVVLIAAVLAIAKRDRPAQQPVPAPTTVPTSAGTTPTQVLPVPPPPPTTPAPAPPQSLPQAPEPRRERSVLGRLTVGIALVVVGVLVALDLVGAASVDAVTVLSAALLVVAAGLLVGTVVGRSRGLIALGVLLVLVLVPVAAIPDGFHAGDGTGTRTFAPTTVAELQDEYRLGAGELVLDLGGLDLRGSQQAVDVSVGAGQITVYLPADTPVTVRAQAGVGNVGLPGDRDNGGLGVDRTWTNAPAGADGSTLLLDLHVGLGEVQVFPSATSLPEVTR